ncbi:MAG: tRNA guanosine(15) transglycosylase TgtA [Halobacteriaceae archaeon]
MTEGFEVDAQDALGRVGRLPVPRADTTVTTPALLPVINPNRTTIDPARLPAFGADIVITNAYIIHRTEALRERALEDGVHDLIDFDGVVVTDSGSFQLAEYGDIDVSTEEILSFQADIGADIGTPVDIPTPPDADRNQVEADLATTRDRLETAAALDTGDMLVNAPVQGGTVPELREAAARHAAGLDLDVYPVGAAVPLLNAYRYAEVVDVVLAAKRGLGPAAPVHLFGAGHPMMFALAAATGCDLFDSAAYALYARDDRYLTVRGTEHLEDLRTFPCSCPVCADSDPETVRALGDDDRERVLAEHNLYVSFGELRRVRQAIHDGDLLELVETRARGHPALLDGYRRLLAATDQVEAADPASKSTFFYVSPESADRPEVTRHHRRLADYDLDGEVLLTDGSHDDGYDTSWTVTPPFGPHPPALHRTYPFTAETPDRLDRAAYEAAARGVARLVEANPSAAVTLAHDGWPATALSIVPDSVTLLDRTTREEGGDR